MNLVVRSHGRQLVVSKGAESSVVGVEIDAAYSNVSIALTGAEAVQHTNHMLEALGVPYHVEEQLVISYVIKENR